MKFYFTFFLAVIGLMAGFAQNAGATPEDVPAKTPAVSETLASPPVLPASGGQAESSKSKGDSLYEDYVDDNGYKDDDASKEEKVTIADPIEPFNRAMNTFNDRMYFWLLKPVGQGYKTVVPEPARISVKNFFSNLKYPARFVSCLLQTDFAGAATETGRFAVNTVWGIGGLMDPAAGEKLDLQKQDADLGQTLGVYGIDHGFYIVWPFFGPSSPRDSVDIIGNQVLYPLSFVNIWYASLGAKAIETVNSTSLRIGDYESLVGAAIDPYISIRDAYAQYRMKDINARKAKSLFFKNPAGVKPPVDKTPEK